MSIMARTTAYGMGLIRCPTGLTARLGLGTSLNLVRGLPSGHPKTLFLTQLLRPRLTGPRQDWETPPNKSLKGTTAAPVSCTQAQARRGGVLLSLEVP